MPLDKDKAFVTNSTTRAQIANALNNHLEDHEHSGVRPFMADDDRLTDEICQRHATAIGEIAPSLSEDGLMDALVDIENDTLVALGILNDDGEVIAEGRRTIMVTLTYHVTPTDAETDEMAMEMWMGQGVEIALRDRLHGTLSSLGAAVSAKLVAVNSQAK